MPKMFMMFSEAQDVVRESFHSDFRRELFQKTVHICNKHEF